MSAVTEGCRGARQLSNRESRRAYGCDRGQNDSILGDEHLEVYGEMSVEVDSRVTESAVPKEKFSLNILCQRDRKCVSQSMIDY